MPRAILVLAMSLILLPAVGRGQLATTEIEVKTAQCEMCADAITSALLKVKGVESSAVDLERKVATVKYDSTLVTVAKLEKAISRAGYNANGLRREKKGYDRLPSCCK